MFFIRDQTTLKETHLASKDELITYLDVEVARLRDTNKKAVYGISYVDEVGEVKEEMELILPSHETVDSLLLNFAQTKEKKGFKLAHQRKSTKDLPSQSSEKAPESSSQHLDKEKIPAKSNKRQLPIKKVGLALASLCLVGLLGGTVWTVSSPLLKQTQSSTNQAELVALRKDLQKIKYLQATTFKIDTFCRYFLPYYYSGETDKLSDFVSIDVRGPESQHEQIKSILLETIEPKGSSYQLTYVLYVKQDDSHYKTIQSQFIVKEDKSKPYGYLVTSSPKESSYPN